MAYLFEKKIRVGKILDRRFTLAYVAAERIRMDKAGWARGRRGKRGYTLWGKI